MTKISYTLQLIFFLSIVILTGCALELTYPIQRPMSISEIVIAIHTQPQEYVASQILSRGLIAPATGYDYNLLGREGANVSVLNAVTIQSNRLIQTPPPPPNIVVVPPAPQPRYYYYPPKHHRHYGPHRYFSNTPQNSSQELNSSNILKKEIQEKTDTLFPQENENTSKKIQTPGIPNKQPKPAPTPASKERQTSVVIGGS